MERALLRGMASPPACRQGAGLPVRAQGRKAAVALPITAPDKDSALTFFFPESLCRLLRLLLFRMKSAPGTKERIKISHHRQSELEASFNFFGLVFCVLFFGESPFFFCGGGEARGLWAAHHSSDAGP